MHQDVRGLDVTTTSPKAVAHLDRAVADYLNYGTSASAEVKAALAEDPSCVLAQCYRGYLLMMLENPAVFPKLRHTLAELEQAGGDITERERLHLSALKAWVKGDLMNACLAWEQVLNQWPQDLMALKLHHTMAFYTGRNNVLRAVVAGALGAWDEATPGYSHVQGMYAYALEECGAYADAERWGRAAVEGNPEDLWAIHSVAHVMEMQGRFDEGADWLDYSRDDWANKNFFKAHVWWHRGLFHIVAENYDRALRVFDEDLSSLNSETYIDVSNQAAFLKRLQIAGVDVGNRWDLLAEHSATRIHDHILPFRDAHFCLALAAKGRFDTAREQIQSMAVFAKDGESWNARTTQAVLIPLCEAMIAYEGGDHAKACDILWPMRNELAPIGGSLAQRDLFAQILIDAAVRAGRLPMARNLLSERVALFPRGRRGWREYGKVLADLGELDLAAKAHRSAETLSSPAAA
jgi:tetratricopeptide (TPR) repeat protein